jgi:hypothetical protein
MSAESLVPMPWPLGVTPQFRARRFGFWIDGIEAV